MTRAIYPGSFDPVTFGHLDIIKRSSEIFDEVIVGILNNSSKTPLFSVEERVNMLKETTREYTNVKIIPFSGLLIDFVQEIEADVIVRGLRAVTDFEYELQMAQTNKVLCSKIDTVFLTTKLEYAYLSSTIVREVALYKGDISNFVPEYVAKCIHSKYNKER